MKRLRLTAVFVCAAAFLLAAEPTDKPAPYSNDFSKSEAGKVPDDFMILDGSFAVAEFQGKKCLEMAGDPVGSFGALFGPVGTSVMDVKAQIWAASSGKRTPEFGIGANDAGGYKLFVVPSLHIIELRKGDDPVASVPFTWTRGSWTWLELRVESKDAKTWNIAGKAWPNDQKPPEKWLISTTDSDAPQSGKASIWGTAYSEQPIRFTDLSVLPL